MNNYIEKQVEKARNIYILQYKGILSDELLDKGSLWYEDFLRSSLTSLLEEVMEALPSELENPYPYEELTEEEKNGGLNEKMLRNGISALKNQVGMDVRIGHNSCRQQFLDNLKNKGLIQ